MAARKREQIKVVNRLAGEALRILRKSVGKKQREVARRLAELNPERSNDYTAISKIETGRRPVTWELLVDLCRALDVSLEAFLTEYQAARRREEAKALHRSHERS